MSARKTRPTPPAEIDLALAIMITNEELFSSPSNQNAASTGVSLSPPPAAAVAPTPDDDATPPSFGSLTLSW